MLHAMKDFCKEHSIPLCENEPMCRHTTFKIGGPADLFVLPGDAAQLQRVAEKANALGVPIFFLGNGSNLLVSDKGIEGVVVDLSRLNTITVDGDTVTCGAGAMLSSLCIKAMEHSLSGLEFAYGIPGTVGGALYMNAGAYGGEMRDVVTGARVLQPDGEVTERSAEEMHLGYRSSAFQNNREIILSVTCRLTPGDKSEIKAMMDDLLCRRKEKQPLEFPSAGSTFKRPEGYFAGALIEQNGLKGLRRGGAMVSEKHAGFVVNTGGATAADVQAVIKEVQETVLRQSGVLLEPEVLFVGRKD